MRESPAGMLVLVREPCTLERRALCAVCFVHRSIFYSWLASCPRRKVGSGDWGAGGEGRVAKRNVSSLGVFPPERQALLPQLGLLPLTAVWGQSPSPMASSLLFLLLSPWQPASLGCANRKGPLCPERGWMGEGRQGRRAELKMLGLGREGKGSGPALFRAGRTGAWRAEGPRGPDPGAANT